MGELTITDKYNNNIRSRYTDLLKAKKSIDLDNYDLAKIFEYYSCIKLSQEYNDVFKEYADIDPEFKELNGMTRNDTGIDCCNLKDTIVQCKLRKETLTWKECSTTFGSMTMYDEKLNENIIRWKKLIITRNNECKLSPNLKEKHRQFIDKPYKRDEIIKYCEELLTTPVNIPIIEESKIKIKTSKTKKINASKKVVRDYQQECIDLIVNSKENVIISLPTGTGKKKSIKKIGEWISAQQSTYPKQIYAMSNPEIYKLWTEFINNEKYKNYFISDKDEWMLRLNELKKYIDDNNKRPSGSKNSNVKLLAGWSSNQQTNYNNKIKNMNDENIYNKWTEFINDKKYKIYFQSNYEKFIIMLKEVKNYIDENNKRPSQKNRNNYINKLGDWIQNQRTYYIKKTGTMSNPEINKLWTEFITDEKYKQYFN